MEIKTGMGGAYMVEDAGDGAPNSRIEALGGIGVDRAAYVLLLGVLNRVVRGERLADRDLGRPRRRLSIRRS